MSNTFLCFNEESCSFVTFEPQLQLHLEEIPKSILGHVPAFVHKPVIGMQEKEAVHTWAAQMELEISLE